MKRMKNKLAKNWEGEGEVLKTHSSQWESHRNISAASETTGEAYRRP